jgi:copper(I)-binding protein
MSITHSRPRSRTRSLALAAVVTVSLTGALAACSDDDSSSSSTTTTAADSSTTTTDSTTTTLPDELPNVAELWTEPVADSGPDVTAKVYMAIQGGATADTLTGVKVDSDLAASAKLTPESSVALPATTTVNLDEDGTYIELEGLAAPLEENRAFYVTLEFESAPDQRVEGAVRNPADPDATN